jgi:hypothetical protein
MDTKGWDVAWEETSEQEWIVEYTVMEGGSTTRHLSVLVGEGPDEVKSSLVDEIRLLYPDASHLEVTVLRLEAIETMDEPEHSGLHVP